MKLFNLSRFAAALVTAALFASPASATLLTFDLDWSGASFGNAATATGSITIDDTVLPNPSGPVFGAATIGVVAFSVTISGAASGNGTFVLADFLGTDEFLWDTAGAILDLTMELVGQPAGSGTWGTPTANCCGDFNIIGSAPGAPQGTGNFAFTADGAQSDELALTSFRPAAVAVPEPSTLAMFGLGVAGFALWRRRRIATAVSGVPR